MTSSPLMKMSMKVGTITRGLKKRSIKLTIVIGSKVKLQDHARLMRSNSLVSNQSKAMIHNTNVTSSLFQTK
jgi:hypothetical protein